MPATLTTSSLNTNDVDAFACRQVPGAVLTDAPVVLADGSRAWLLRQLGRDFTALVFGEAPAWLAEFPEVSTLVVGKEVVDASGLVRERLDAAPGTLYLIRPDQHICARWKSPTRERFSSALARATAKAH